MIYGYARVSTRGQAADGFGLEAQKRLLRQNGAEYIFEESFTGTKKHRPELDKLMAVIDSGDTLVVAKLDRIARSTIHGCDLINELLNRGVIVNVLNMGVMDNSTTGKLMRSVFFAFAEFERDMIVERTSEGKAVARQRDGYREGRKPKDTPDFQKFLEKQKGGQLTVDECCKALGISRSSWYARVKEVSS